MSLFRRGEIWWYEFWLAGRRIAGLKHFHAQCLRRPALRSIPNGYSQLPKSYWTNGNLVLHGWQWERIGALGAPRNNRRPDCGPITHPLQEVFKTANASSAF
jgi:hypothetical protein